MSTVLPPPPPEPLELPLLGGEPAGAPPLLLLLLELLLPQAASKSSDATIRHALIAFARTLIKVVLLMVDRAVNALDFRESSRALGSQQPRDGSLATARRPS
jgi:hypothetical protein